MKFFAEFGPKLQDALYRPNALLFRVFNCCFNLFSVFSGPQLLADATPQPSPALNFWRPPGGRR